MKPMSVLAAVSLSVLAFACRKDEPTSETFTTSAPFERQEQPPPPVQPVVPPTTEGTTTTGTSTDVGNTQGGGAENGTTSTSTNAIQKGRDAGAMSSDVPTGGRELMDRQGLAPNSTTDKTGGNRGGTSSEPTDRSGLSQGSGMVPSELGTGQNQNAKQPNRATPGGGGKGTWGTDAPKDTHMDKR